MAGVVRLPLPGTRRVPVEIERPSGGAAWERAKAWCKRVEAVDTRQRGGYAFVGEFVRFGRCMQPLGAWLVLYAERDGAVTAQVALVGARGLHRRAVIHAGRSEWAAAVREVLVTEALVAA